MLRDRVEGGDLPPLEDRLPQDPVVVDPVDRLGVYGGTWNGVQQGTASNAALGRTIGYEGLMRWNPDWTDIIPNVAKSVDASADGREFTITLRAGMKWSDGEPFAADDLVFAYEDVYLNKELTPVAPSWLGGDEPATLEKIDDQTIRFIYAQPRGLFVTDLARVETATLLVDKPRHYLEQFHADYNPDVQELADTNGFANWVELFLAEVDPFRRSEIPTLNAWILTKALGESTEVVGERNPYYWKVDPEGRQLPYIDAIRNEIIDDTEAILLRAASGEVDFQFQYVNSLANKPVLADSRESGNFDFITLNRSTMNELIVSLNLTHEDPVKREVFQNKDFRIGLSHAINRPELIDAAFQGQGEPWQAAPNPESVFFDEDMAKQYTEYDTELANEHLDTAGYRDRDAQDYRLGPDGNRISFSVEVPTPSLNPAWVDAMEIIIGYWQQVGIDARIETEDSSLYEERTMANAHDASIWEGTGGFGDEMLGPLYYFPSRNALVAWAVQWANWFLSRGQDPAAEEPPEAPLQQMELYWQLTETPDEAEREDLFRQIMDIAKEQFYTIGTVRVPENYAIVSNDLNNVPDAMWDSFRYPTPAPTNTSQYFLER